MTIPSAQACWSLIMRALLAGVVGAEPWTGDEGVVSAQEVSKAASGPKKPQRSIAVQVFGPGGTPLAGAQIHRSVWTKQKGFKANKTFDTNGDGKAVVDLPATFYIVRLWARKKGYVPLFAHWEQEELAAGEDAVPKAFTFRLRKGTTIGGVVLNTDGRPIQGAKVEVQRVSDPLEERERTMFCIWLAEGGEGPCAARTTDAQGFWKLDNVPPGVDVKVRVKLSHPDYINDRKWGGLQHEQKVSMESLRNLSSTIVMRRGVRATGAVTDPKGKPVAGAVVVWGDDPYFQTGKQEVRTDKKGVYRFPPLSPGPTNVTVIAKGLMPARKQIEIAPKRPPVQFKLKPGKTLRIRFVDQSGKPVPEVYVGIAGWRGGKSLYNHRHPEVLNTKIPRRADAQGLYTWTWAPADSVKYSFYKEGYRSLRDRALAAREAEHEIRLVKEQ